MCYRRRRRVRMRRRKSRPQTHQLYHSPMVKAIPPQQQTKPAVILPLAKPSQLMLPALSG